MRRYEFAGPQLSAGAGGGLAAPRDVPTSAGGLSGPPGALVSAGAGAGAEAAAGTRMAICIPVCAPHATYPNAGAAVAARKPSRPASKRHRADDDDDYRP